MKRKLLSISKLFRLLPGDKFIVYWAKDDDPQYVRLNYEVQIVAHNDGESLQTEDDYEWCRDECAGLNPEENILDTSRGHAYFYEAPDA